MGYTGDLDGGNGFIIKNLVIEACGTFIFSYVYLNQFLTTNSFILFLSVLTVLNWVCFPLSGAHFNPCVTLALMAKNKIDVKKGLMYLAVQFGATFAAAFVLWINQKESSYFGRTKGDWWDSRMPQVNKWVLNDKEYMGLFYEFMATFSFTLIFFAANVGKGGTAVIAGFIIGLGYCFANTMVFKYTGGACNPYFYIAPRLLTMTFKDIVWYIFGPILGALAAAFVYEPLVGDAISDDETPLIDLK